MAVSLPAASDAHLYCVGVGFLDTSLPYSLSVWINANWTTGGTCSMVGLYDGIPATGTPTGGAGLQIGTTNGSGDLVCWVYGGAALINSANALMTPYNGKWVLITYVWDGTTHHLYLNGSQVATSTTVYTASVMTQVYINGFPPTGSTTETSAIKVDTYSYYNRALQLSEIQTIYSSAGTRNGIVSGLKASYEFDDGPEGTVLTSGIDLTGFGSTLKTTGTASANIKYTYVGTLANQNTRPVQC